MTAAGSASVERSAGIIVPGELRDPDLRGLLRYWEERCDDGCVPARADIDPLDFPRLLPRVFMVRVEHDPLSFVYSLVGEENIEAHGYNFTGMDVRELDRIGPGYGSSMHSFYSLVSNGGRALAAAGNMSFVDRDFRAFEALYLPLASKNGRVEHIMGAASYGSCAGPF